MYLDGVTKLINITYEAVDINQNYVQVLNLDVEATGDPAPAPPPDPVPYAKPQGFSQDITDYLKISKSAQPGICKKRMFDNISAEGAVKGLVTAAQSKSEPDYWYHWIRDAALTMDVVVMLYGAASKSNKDFYERELFWYAQASADEQNDPTAITGLAEPKFYLNNNTGYLGVSKEEVVACSKVIQIANYTVMAAMGPSSERWTWISCHHLDTLCGSIYQAWRLQRCCSIQTLGFESQPFLGAHPSRS